MSTGARASAVAAERPPNPAPTITTWGRACGKFPASFMSLSNSEHTRLHVWRYIQPDNYIASTATEGYSISGHGFLLGEKGGPWSGQLISSGSRPSVLAWHKQ